jgi:hypothetical protein
MVELRADFVPRMGAGSHDEAARNAKVTEKAKNGGKKMEARREQDVTERTEL